MEKIANLLATLGDKVGLVGKVRDWKEAVRLSGEFLLKDGCIEPRYIDGMIKTCEKLGPYIAICPGIAIPHARPEDGAKGVCLSLLVVKNGVIFGSHNDPVYVLIAFSTPDKKSHIKVIQELAKLLMEKSRELVEYLKKAKSEKEIMKIVEKISS